MRIDKPYTDNEYAVLASYCNENSLIIEDKGDYLESVEKPYIPPTKEQISKWREQAYEREVDGKYTAQIDRLKDEVEYIQEEIEELKKEEQTPEIIKKIIELKENMDELNSIIPELMKERREVVKSIKEKYPYNTEDN